METWIVKLEGLLKGNLAGVHFQKTHWSSVTAETTLQTELAQRLMPVEKVLAEKTTPEEEPKNIGIEVAGGIGKGLGHAGKELLIGAWDILWNPFDVVSDVLGSAFHPIDTYTYIKTSITESYERDVTNGDAYSRAYWFSYAIGSTLGAAVGTKGVGAVAKSGTVTKTLSATKNAVNKSTLQNFLPYAPQNQFAFAGNIPFNTLNGPVVKENLIVRAKLEFDGKGITNATKNNYRKLYLEQYRDLPKGWQVHHTLPQKYETIMKNEEINIHEVQHLKGIDPKIHSKITNEWSKWDKKLGRTPTPKDIIDFANIIESKYGKYWHNK